MVLIDLLLFQFLGSQFLSIVSWMSELVAFRFIWSSAKFLPWISMDDGIFGYVLSSFGFNVETDVGINGCFAPFWQVISKVLVDISCSHSNHRPRTVTVTRLASDKSEQRLVKAITLHTFVARERLIVAQGHQSYVSWSTPERPE